MAVRVAAIPHLPGPCTEATVAVRMGPEGTLPLYKAPPPPPPLSSPIARPSPRPANSSSPLQTSEEGRRCLSLSPPLLLFPLALLCAILPLTHSRAGEAVIRPVAVVVAASDAVALSLVLFSLPSSLSLFLSSVFPHRSAPVERDRAAGASPFLLLSSSSPFPPRSLSTSLFLRPEPGFAITAPSSPVAPPDRGRAEGAMAPPSHELSRRGRRRRHRRPLPSPSLSLALSLSA